MTTLPSGDIFTRLCGWVENLHADKGLCLHTGTCAMSPCEEQISLADLRSERTGSSDNGPWSHIARHVREEVASGQEGRWTLIALWLLTPRLRGAARVIARRTGAERADICSALLQGVLEGTRTAATADPAQFEQDLVDAAFTAGWRTGRRSPHETPTVEWDRAHGVISDAVGATASAVGLVQGDVMSLALSRRAQGERLGSLAHRLDLLDHVRRVRRLRRARGAIARNGVAHMPFGQQSLFETGELGDDTWS